MARTAIALLPLLLAPGLVLAQAQQAPTATAPQAGQTDATLQVAEAPQFGPYLVDSQGRALYLFTADKQGARDSACSGKCAEAWPPLVSDDMPRLGGPVRQDLVGTFQRPDGKKQVTYNGWPLYYFVNDRGPGQTTGQDKHGFGGEWYLVTPEGGQVAER